MKKNKNRIYTLICSVFNNYFGSGTLPGEMLLARIIENNKIDAYFRSG